MGDKRYIVAGSLIDGSGGAVRRNVLLSVQEGTITAMAPAAELPRSSGVPVDDFSHCIILPALVDCSVSLSQSPSVDPQVRRSYAEAGFEQKAVMLERHIHYCHTQGVLGVADSDLETKLSAPSHDVLQGSSIAIRRSAGICRSRLDSAAGLDFLKIGYSGTIEEDAPSPSGLDRDALAALLQQRGEKKAVVVANGRQRVEEALEAGCDAIEQGYGMGEDALRKMAAKNVLWIPSLLRAKNALDGATSGGDVCCRFSLRYAAPGKPVPGAEAHWKKMLAEQLAQLGLARQLGVRTAMGTGAGSAGILHGESMAEEMKLFIKAGFSLEETFACASENGARFFGMEGLGMLTVGRKATFLIARGTVQQLPRKLSYLEGIYVDGAPSSTYHKNGIRTI